MAYSSHVAAQPNPKLKADTALHARPFSFAEPFFEPVGQKDDLTGGVIPALTLDSKGVLWIGTQFGLVRYDGFRFRKFVNDPRDPHSIAENYVTRLCLGSDGRLWVGLAGGGVSVFDPKTETFQNHTYDPKVGDGLSEGRIYGIAEDSAGTVWVGSAKGLNVLAVGGERFIRYREEGSHPEGLKEERIRSLFADRNQNLWVGSMAGVHCRGKGQSRFEAVTFRTEEGVALEAPEALGLFEASDGIIWIGTRGQGVFRLDPQTKIATALGLDKLYMKEVEESWVWSIIQATPDEIWLGTYGQGIVVLSAVDGRFVKQILHDPTLPGGLAGNEVLAMLSSPSGMLWVGYWGSGLQRHNPKNRSFHMLRHSPLRPKGLSYANVQSVLECRDGRILVGTEGNGIDIIDRYKGLVGGYRPQPAAPGAFIESRVYAMAETGDESLWVATQINGIQRLAKGAARWQTFSTEHGLPNNRVFRLLVTDQDVLWVAMAGGLARWRAERERFEAVNQEDGNEFQQTVQSIAEDKDERLWVGTSQGLMVVEPGQMKIRQVEDDSTLQSGILSNDISSVFVDRSGQLWVGTFQELVRLKSWDGRKATFENMGHLLGLSGVYAAEIQEDLQGRIWTDTFVLDPKRMELTEFFRADGFEIDGVWRGASTRTRDGLILLGGPLGLAVIEPEKFEPWSYLPPVVTSSLKINGVSQPLGSTSSKLVLSAERRDFAVEFSALDYSAPEKTKYRYRLVNRDKEWIETDSASRVAAYGNLWPGHYKLEVMGSNRNGAWSERILEIPVEVLPAYWQTGWFATLLVLGLGGCVFGGNRWNTRRLKARARELQRMVDGRTADILNLGKIGQELTATLDLEQAFERVYQQVSARLDAHVFSIGLFDAAQERIQFVYLTENDKRVILSEDETAILSRPALLCVNQRREICTETRGEMVALIGEDATSAAGEAMETQVFMPLLAQQKVIGCLSVQSTNPRAYDEDQRKFLRILSSYAAIALENANTHNQLLVSHKRLVESQQQLVIQEKMAGIGTLTAGIAHELNNPLNFIKNLSEVSHELVRDFRGEIDEKQGKVLDEETMETIWDVTDDLESNTTIILKHGRRADQIVKAMQELVHKSGSKKAALDFNSFVEEYVKIGFNYEQTKGEFRDLTLEFELDSSIGKVMIRPQDMSRVMNHLINNAVYAVQAKQKAAGGKQEKGQILVRTKRLEKKVLLEVWDNGTGIEAAHLNEVFTPFFTTKPTGMGNIGLGLSTTYDVVVKEHEGEIRVESERGEWTSVKIQLPLETLS